MSSADYRNGNSAQGSGMTGGNIQKAAFFGLDVSSNTGSNTLYQGHFYPMYHHFTNGMNGWFTTMDMFLNGSGNPTFAGISPEAGSNYFRVAPTGLEF